MNRQRKVLITTTYNELGIIIDTKAEEVAQPEVAKDTNVPNNDCISRQQAIDALDKHIDTFDAIDTNYLCGLRTSMSILKEMPSAQPEKRTEERAETHACDLIDREAAVDAIYHHLPSVSRTRARTMLHEVPSAQPEHKKGKWIYHSNWESDGECGYECSECGMGFDVDYGYCMRCGARMEGESDE